MYIAVARNLKTTILQEGYKAARRGHVPGAKTPEKAKSAWKKYNVGDPVVLKVVNLDGSDYANGQLIVSGGYKTVTLWNGGYRINAGELSPENLRQYSSVGSVDVVDASPAKVVPKIVNGYLCIPFTNWEIFTRVDLDKIQGVTSAKKARDAAMQRNPGVYKFKTIHRGVPKWEHQAGFKYWYKSSDYWSRWTAKGR